jgi:hypothetical protein
MSQSLGELGPVANLAALDFFIDGDDFGTVLRGVSVDGRQLGF